MSRNMGRWIRGKTGRWTIGGLLAVLLVVAIVGQVLGWWGAVANLITGTVGPPPGGYSCLPTCEVDDGKFLLISNSGQATFSGEPIIVWISVPEDYQSFDLGIFDGDSGKADDGTVTTWWEGNWDDTVTEATYTLYADPLKNGKGNTVIGTWMGNQDPMPNNDWYDLTIDTVADAKGPNGNYYYRLEVTQPAEPVGGGNAFKLRSTAYLATGKSTVGGDDDDLVEASFAIVGMIANMNDVQILYPQFAGDFGNPGPSNYTGEWQFYFYIPVDEETLSFWDGDFDRGTSSVLADDKDDPNTEGKPPWAGPFAVNERAGGRGAPADDYSYGIFRREPPVQYQLTDPDGQPIYTNSEPSGTEEWEHFVVSTDATINPDLKVEEIQPGFYTVYIEGLDLHNLVFIRTEYCIADEPFGCSDPWEEGNCPRTIGYWKNNVRKAMEGKKGGRQETDESLEWAFRNIALATSVYCSGMDVTNPVEMDPCEPLTFEEANAILQKENGNSMLDRALQQNMATWLNMATGKVGPTTVIRLEGIAGGTFEGTLGDALQEAMDIILNGGDLERAKDIADMINNGELNADPEDMLDCREYEDIIPPDKQPPKFKDMPKAPKKDEAPDPTAVPEPDPETCAGVRVNQYKVEATNNPFAGIKFEFTSGTEVKNGDFDEFKVTLAQAEAEALSSVQVEGKAGTNVGQATLEGCDFSSPLPCGVEPVQDENDYFAFYFMGAEDNGDGTMTLTFHVQNMTGNGLSHATIGIPEGVVPSSYESEVCPPQ